MDRCEKLRDNLYCGTEVTALALAVQNRPEHFAGAYACISREAFVDKALIVAEVKVRFGAVVRYKHLAVLQRAHGARVHVHIGVQLLAGHL